MTVALPRLSVIVVSHNSGAPLHDCIKRVLAQPLPLEVLLVDNASDDASLDELPSHPSLRTFRNSDNRGFGAACNQGARVASADHLLFLNPDCLLPAGALERLLSAIQSEPSIGLLGARLVEADGSPQPAARRPLPTLAGLLRRRSGHVGYTSAGLEIVEATSGALLLLPRPVFEALGGFDEGYVLHCEDLDLCRRVTAAGWKIAIVPDLLVTHLKGCSSRRRPIWVEWQKHRGMLRYLRKFECTGLAMPLYPLLWLAVWMRLPIAGTRAWLAARRS